MVAITSTNYDKIVEDERRRSSVIDNNTQS